MAAIQFLIRGTKEIESISLRLTISRESRFLKKSGYFINPKDWSPATGEPIKRDDRSLKRLKTDLDRMKTEILNRVNQATSAKETINAAWLEKQINELQGKQEKDERTAELLTAQFDLYLAKLPTKVMKNGRRGATPGTVQKYRSTKKILLEFEAHTKKTYRVQDINPQFIEQFVDFATNKAEYSHNYTGRVIKFIKTVCLFAIDNGIPGSREIKKIKGFKEPAEFIYLTTEELTRIEKTYYGREALKNAADWLIIGCHVGQRVSDLLKMTASNITTKSGLQLIEIKQQKTNKRVTIPIRAKVAEILNRHGGNFPRKISATRFNEYIKDVAELAEINEPTPGSIMEIKIIDGKKVTRKTSGTFPKYKLVSSHICRRTFATTNYGTTPTALLISVTGHASEAQFLQYIGKSSSDMAIQLAEFWNREILEAKKKPQLTVLKQAK